METDAADGEEMAAALELLRDLQMDDAAALEEEPRAMIPRVPGGV